MTRARASVLAAIVVIAILPAWLVVLLGIGVVDAIAGRLEALAPGRAT